MFYFHLLSSLLNDDLENYLVNGLLPLEWSPAKCGNGELC